jgi:hypothetical protein
MKLIFKFWVVFSRFIFLFYFHIFFILYYLKKWVLSFSQHGAAQTLFDVTEGLVPLLATCLQGGRRGGYDEVKEMLLCNEVLFNG